MTRFDSQQYHPIEEFAPLMKHREEAIEWRGDHEDKLKEIPAGTLMRYVLSVQHNWWEETFLFSDGDRLVLYHDLPIEADGQAYIQQVCTHYGFLVGFRWDTQTTDEEYRRKTVHALLADDQFTFNEKTVVFWDGEQPIPIGIHLLEEGNVLLRTETHVDEFLKDQLKTKLLFLIPLT